MTQPVTAGDVAAGWRPALCHWPGRLPGRRLDDPSSCGTGTSGGASFGCCSGVPGWGGAGRAGDARSASAAGHSVESDDLRLDVRGIAIRRRRLAGGGAVGAVSGQLAALGLSHGAPRRRHALAAGAPPGRQFGEVGANGESAGRQPVPPLRRGHRLGVLRVLPVRPRPAGRSHDAASPGARAVCTAVPCLRTTPAWLQSSLCRPLGGHHHVGYRTGRTTRSRRDRRRRTGWARSSTPIS